MDKSNTSSSCGGESPPPPSTSTPNIQPSIGNRTDSILSVDSYSSCSDNDAHDNKNGENRRQSNVSLRSKSEVYMEEASLEHSLDNHSKFVKRDKFTRELVDGGALLKNVGGRPDGFIQLEQPADGEGEGIVASKLNEASIRELGGSFVSELGASVMDEEDYLVSGMDSEKAFETFDPTGGHGNATWHPRESLAERATSEPVMAWKGSFRKAKQERGSSWPVDLVDVGEDDDGNHEKGDDSTTDDKGQKAAAATTKKKPENVKNPKSKGSTSQGIFSSASSNDVTERHKNFNDDSSCSSESSVDSKNMMGMFGSFKRHTMDTATNFRKEDGEKGQTKEQRRNSLPKLRFQMRENTEKEETSTMRRRGSFGTLQAILNRNSKRDNNDKIKSESKDSDTQPTPQAQAPKTTEEILLSSKVLESSITELRKAAIESKRQAAANAKMRATEKNEVTREMEDALADAIRYAAAATTTKDEESGDGGVMKLGLRMGRTSLLGGGGGGGGGKGYHFTLPGVTPDNKSTASSSHSNERLAASSDTGSSRVGLFGRGKMSISKLLPGGGGKKGPLNRSISSDYVESQPNIASPQHRHSSSDIPPSSKVEEQNSSGSHELRSDAPEIDVEGREDKPSDKKDEGIETDDKLAAENGDEFDGETLLLHAIFRKFCQPPPSLESVRLILQLERKRSSRMRPQRRRSSASAVKKRKVPKREETASMLRKRKSRRWSVDASGYLTRRISSKSILSTAGSNRSILSDEGSAYSGVGGIEENLIEGDESEGVNGNTVDWPRRRSSSLDGDVNKAPSSPSSSRIPPPASSKDQSVPLPLDALITVGRDAGLSVTRLLCFNPQQCLLALPAPFCMAFFRILIRILTNETDKDYDEECLFWYEDENDSDEEDEEEEDNLNEIMHQSQDSLTLDALDARAGAGTAEKRTSEIKDNNRENTAPSFISLKSRADVDGSNISSERSLRGAERRNLSFSFGEKQTKRRALEALEMRTKWINDNMNFNFTNSQRLNISVTNRLYSIVRFRCSDGWEAAASDDSGKVKKSSFTKRGIVSAGLGAWDAGCAVSSMLRLFELLLHCKGSSEEGGVLSPCCDAKKLDKLFGPVARLLGLTCMAGVSVKSLRRVLSLITSIRTPGKRTTGGTPTNDLPASCNLLHRSLHVPKISMLARLHLIRALSSAAEGASQSTRLLKKASPRHFFVFGNGPGLVRTITQSSWPFKNDFGVACWFRAEHFEKKSDPILVSVRTEDGGGVEVSLEVFGSTAEANGDGNDSMDGGGIREGENSANCATLVVSVYDSEDLAGGVSSHGTKIVRLQGCVLSSRVWYHIAVRHTRPRFKGFNFALSAKEEVSILLDGKVMLTEPLKFPKVSNTSGALHGTAGQTISDTDSVTSVSTHSQSGGVEGPTVNSPPSPPRAARASVSSSAPAFVTFSITFGSGFDGQTGALYVFKDHVADEVLRSLFELTANATSFSHFHDSMGDKTWDSQKGEMARIANEVNAEMLPADAEEFVVSRQRSSVASISGAAMAAAAAVLDLGEDEDFGDPNCPPQLSRGSFGAKLFLVWDPSRTSGRVVLEAHSGSHVNMGSGYGSADIQPWCVEGAKDVIASIGGVQALLPLFRVLLNGDFVGAELDGEDNNKDEDPFDEDEVHSLIPNLILLLASFLRGHSDNAREMLRCGGIDIVEQSLLQDKISCEKGLPTTKGGSSSNLLSSRKRTLTSVIRTSPRMSRLLVDALISLRRACSHNVALETKVFSRLLINMPLWLGKVTNTPGVALHAALLPTFSAAARSTPNKVRACVSMKELIELVKEHTLVGNTREETSKYETESLTEAFDRSPESGLSKDSLLTINERRHVIDIILGVIPTILIPRTTPLHLSPLINFISFHLDIEWESANADKQNQSVIRIGSRKERYLTTRKVCVVLLYLLQCRPQIPGLYESIEECLINADGAASWMLCCMVNSFDDMIRSLGIRCLTAFLDVAAPSSIPSSNPTVVSSDTTEESPQAVDNQRVTDLAQNQMTVAKGASTITRTMKYVGTGLGVISSSNVLSNILVPSKANPKIIYKLLWHLLKCHRERLGDSSHSALVHLLVDDGSAVVPPAKSNLLDKIVKPDYFFTGGFQFNNEWATLPIAEVGIDTSQNVRNTYAVSTILRLMRFLSNDMKERWLFDLLALMRVSQPSVRAVLPSCDWQPCLFHMVSEIVEEINSNGDGSSKKVDHGEIDALSRVEMESKSEGIVHSMEGKTEINTDKSKGRSKNEEASHAIQRTGKPPVRTRFDLALKLYSTLLGHSVRQGGDKAFHAVEQAASLQRVCVNGHEVFSIVLSHLLAELIENGTVANIDSMMDINTKRGALRNKALKQSARIVTQAILSNGADGLDMATAVKQWRCLRHLTAVTVAVVTTSGFGVAELFDYRNQNASAVDEISGGLHGIRLPEGAISGITASDAMAGAGFNTHDSANSPERHRSERENYRRVCVILASQILSLLDAFIFPDTLDATQPTSQLHGLTLVRSTEPRLGQAQGPLLASLVRLSLLLLAHLEPSSVRFLQCCSRLRCFLHWTLELIRESVALGGYSAAFHELTAPLDRLVLAVVLQCHRAFSRCSAVLIEIESSPADKYFPSIDSRQKNYRRLFRATLELREIVLAAYRGRNEVLRAALSLQAYEALQAGLEEINNQKLQGLPKSHRRSSMSRTSGSRASGNRASASGGSSSKEASLRAFMANSWVTGFHDVDIDGGLVIPEQVANGQIYRHRTASNRGRLAIEELASESKSIINDYNRALNAPFEAYCEDQRQWAETDAVRDMEYEGDIAVKRLSAKYRSDLTQITRLASLRTEAAEHRWKLVERKVNEPWIHYDHWKLAKHTDRLNRRILLVRNREFNSHEEASYELMLGREREKAQKFREERLRKLKEKKEKELSDSQRPKEKVVIFGDLNDEENEGRQMTKVSSMVRVASKGIIPFAEYASEDNEDADDIDDITLEPDEAETEESQIPDDDKEDEHISEHHNTDTGDWDQVGPEDYEQYEEGELEKDTDSNAWAKAFAWSEGEHLVHSFESVVLVTLQTIKEGILLLTTHGLYFHPTEDEINVMTKETVSTTNDKEDQRDRRWRLSRLTEVHGRRYMLRAQALELFFADSHELFINFNGGTKERDKFYAKLRNSCKVPMLCSPKSLNPRTVFKRSNLTELWRKRKISNFDYLMQLNIMAGRTFNDITQYPVFPWILADYTSKELDLSDTRVFRDLSKPVGALNPDRLSQLIERYHNLDGFPEEERFLYGSHYSSPGVVLHYLIRQEPFTTMAIELQSGRFDCPDRLFFDLAGTWKSCMTSTSDVKELTPEFFTCPEIFLNTCNFPLGETQSGVPVNNVKLPPWANGSPYEFVRMHRLALESEYVSQNLSHWVDLIFGFKQRGPNAAAAHNVFHYLSYEGSVDLDKITDPLDRKATESHIQNFGQTPSQLIVKEPHPARSVFEECWKPLCYEIPCLKELRCHTPKKQFGGIQTLGAVISIHVLTESIVVIYSDLSVGTYKWSASRNGFSFKMDKLRILGCRDASMSPSAVYGGSCAPERIVPKKSRPGEDGTNNLTNDGKSVVGHWSFGMTLGGSVNDGLRRRAAMGTRTAKPFEGSSSLTDASYLLLSCGYFDGTVKMHSIDGLRMKCSGSGGHRGAINCLRIGEDGGLMITGGQDATCRVWVVDHSDMASALTDGYVQTALARHDSEGGDNLLSCCHVLWGHEEAITCLDFSSDLDVVVSGSTNGIVCIHSVRRGKFIRSIDMNESSFDRALHNRFDLHTSVRLLTLHSSGSFATHLEDGMLLLYTINGVKLGSTDAGEKLNTMAICTGGEMLVTGGESCHVVIRSMRDLGVLCVLDMSNHGPIRCITLAPSSLNPAPQFMYVGTDDGKVTIVDRGSQKIKPMAEDEDEVPYWNVK